MEQHYQIPAENSWLLAAWEEGIPVYHPGWEDSTTGNMFAAGGLPRRGPASPVREERHRADGAPHALVPRGERLQRGQEEGEGRGRGLDKPSVGFFQVGGGIAGDFAICAVPTIVQDLQMRGRPVLGLLRADLATPSTSYGGYSGAVPNEKITWGKLDVDTPKFMIQSDATIVAPLIFAYVLGD